MNMTQRIKEKIEKEFDPLHFELINESHKHIGHAGDDGSGETHYKLIVASGRFDDLSRIERQRAINTSLKELFDSGLHALSLSLISSSEYKNTQ